MHRKNGAGRGPKRRKAFLRLGNKQLGNIVPSAVGKENMVK